MNMKYAKILQLCGDTLVECDYDRNEAQGAFERVTVGFTGRELDAIEAELVAMPADDYAQVFACEGPKPKTSVLFAEFYRNLLQCL